MPVKCELPAAAGRDVPWSVAGGWAETWQTKPSKDYDGKSWYEAGRFIPRRSPELPLEGKKEKEREKRKKKKRKKKKVKACV